MRLVNVFFIVLLLLVLMVLGNLYLTNHDLLVREVVVFGESIKLQSVILVTFLLGFLLNVLYTGIMEVIRLVRGLNDSADTRLVKRISERMQDARDLVAHGLPREAKGILESILEQRREHIPARILLSDILIKTGSADAAVKLLQALCEEEPDQIEARYQLAEAFMATRNPEAAVAGLKKLAADQPKKALRAWRRLRALHMEAQRWEEAAEAHKKLVTHFASELTQGEKAQGAALAYQVGMTKVETDQFKDAAQIFQQVIKDEPDFVPAYLSLGRCMILQDQEAQGLEILIEGFRKTGEGTFLQEMEDYFIQLGRPEDGLALMRRVAATSQHATTAKFFLGKMLYRLEILDEALDLFQEVRSQVVYSPILFFFMAKIHSRRARLDAALNEYRQLLRNLGILKQRYECAVCGHRTQDYADRCDSCGSWNSHHFMFKESDLPEGPVRNESGSWMAML
ncbi:MAG: tetratricopeptide repeat protein [Holophagaceae bacterium]|uniref:Tetratricopeptide repeat protein n=1 Tax=Candidatus Geothrix skivensis TaxID=2954439 RepID=A0A9D7SFX6_9BACT|nr:tetratricopeptide repeat protein [Candidatus Geothrix skivensis]